MPGKVQRGTWQYLRERPGQWVSTVDLAAAVFGLPPGQAPSRSQRVSVAQAGLWLRDLGFCLHTLTRGPAGDRKPPRSMGFWVVPTEAAGRDPATFIRSARRMDSAPVHGPISRPRARMAGTNPAQGISSPHPPGQSRGDGAERMSLRRHPRTTWGRMASLTN